ncbi:hypothetical protein EDF69_002492 [Sphingomonas sp. JUb134]|nr:hypothetical protein [Sphingomonas sp. JUb134]
MQLTDDDYYELEAFVRAVMHRVQSGACGVDEGVRSLMHPLTAWDRANWAEFAPWMRLQRDEWRQRDT